MPTPPTIQTPVGDALFTYYMVINGATWPIPSGFTALGDTPITWSISAGSLPTGMTLNSDGTLSGTPTVSGNYTFTVHAVNGAGSDSRVYHWPISELNDTLYPNGYPPTPTSPPTLLSPLEISLVQNTGIWNIGIPIQGTSGEIHFDEVNMGVDTDIPPSPPNASWFNVTPYSGGSPPSHYRQPLKIFSINTNGVALGDYTMTRLWAGYQPGNTPLPNTTTLIFSFVVHIVSLSSPPPTPPTCSISAVPTGGSLLISWTTTNNPTSASIDQGIGAVNTTGGSLTIPLPTVTTTYTLTVSNAAGSSQCQATVTITPPTPPTNAAPGALEFVPFGGNGSYPGVAVGFGNIYTIPTDPQGDPVLLTDDDYGQIFPYYTTYFFVNHEQEMALQLGAHRKMLSYFTALINGTGNITITALMNVIANAWPLNVTRALAVQAVFDLEWAGASATAQRMAFKFASSPITGTNNGFQLEKCVATLKPVTHLPVRGSAQ